MKILISGASGFVGTSLAKTLQSEGCTVFKLVRKKQLNQSDEIYWNPETQEISLDDLESFDAFINLAGENISSGRWTDKKKHEIKASRLNSTKLLKDSILKLKNPPKLFINASAIGFYGDRKKEIVSEESSKGGGFLSDVCLEWENEIKPISDHLRLIILRFGVILDPKGGALKKMLIPFKLGVGGVIGSGDQMMSWISLDDVTRIISFALKDEKTSGVYNVVAPHPVSNYVFTETLGKVLSRPTFFRVPTFAVKLIFGQMGQEVLLQGQNVSSDKLIEAGYNFKHTHLEHALEEMLKEK